MFKRDQNEGAPKKNQQEVGNGYETILFSKLEKNVI